MNRLIDQIKELTRMADMESDYMFKADEYDVKMLHYEAYKNEGEAKKWRLKREAMLDARRGMASLLKSKINEMRSQA